MTGTEFQEAIGNDFEVLDGVWVQSISLNAVSTAIILLLIFYFSIRNIINIRYVQYKYLPIDILYLYISNVSDLSPQCYQFPRRHKIYVIKSSMYIPILYISTAIVRATQYHYQYVLLLLLYGRAGVCGCSIVLYFIVVCAI